MRLAVARTGGEGDGGEGDEVTLYDTKRSELLSKLLQVRQTSQEMNLQPPADEPPLLTACVMEHSPAQ